LILEKIFNGFLRSLLRNETRAFLSNVDGILSWILKSFEKSAPQIRRMIIFKISPYSSKIEQKSEIKSERIRCNKRI